ncbi:hypothetical protein BK654_06730 [Pseudomonas brassicacearum]|uniref:DUF6161 domain-containing protein n=1 Tax=Pseudomonas brassicacearum TaxID=930166 RepID=UPI000F46AD96|nr:DUF6161 domain-containing protein [Pseudomonas brassicacearum]ROM79063.1 hypothetical protein BK654_06730 [Pseudomonas brassicacearum]
MTTLVLKALSGEHFEFDYLVDQYDFMRNELNFWKPKIKNLQQKGKSSPHQALENLEACVAILEYHLAQEEQYLLDEEPPEEELSDVWIFSNSPATIKWLEIYSNAPAIAAGFYDAIFLGKSDNQGSFNDFSGYLAAYEFRLPLQNSFAQRSTSEAAVIRGIHSNFFKVKYRLVKKARKEMNQFAQWQKQEEDAWATRLETLESTYKEKLRLEGPATYWAKKASEHQTRGYIWTGVLSVTLFFSVIGLWTSFNLWLSGDRTPIALNQIEGALIFVTLISTLAFTVKTLSKLVFSAFHLQRDAEEREQLTHLYLTLSKDTQVDDESRKIILQSLFSRSETGLISNESGPTMPGLTDLLSAFKKG